MRVEGGACEGAGNANLPIGDFRDANREIGVPGLKAHFQAGAYAGWRRDCSSREQAGEIQHVQLVGQIVALDFEGDVSSLFVEQRGARGRVKREIRTYAARVEVHLVQNGGAIL